MVIGIRPPYEAGDDITLKLEVFPENDVPTDGTTLAAVVCRCDDGTVVTPPVIPNDDRNLWHATLLGANAGEWSIVWTVTGTGSGVQTYTVLVAAVPVVPQPGRTYASVAELSAYTGDSPPPNATRLLHRATRKVDQLLRFAVYPVDEQGMPLHLEACTTGVDVLGCLVAALRDATCAQVEWWNELGDEYGSGSVAALAGAQIGTVRLPSGNASAGGGSGSLEYAPDALTILSSAGLSSQGPIVPGPNGYGALYPAGWP